ncbi:hypothetical protein [Sphingomonas xanthus]|uniref:Uncharacterized protein n=1 Tax=Sphingomonas xanthus TaxID=2594473 RepID=A0A516IQ40_9SPHN|nr:hypothetical protein [Sphingomonas xanthus]QDP19032.1 hypothetical protein FMM02_03090 [Sphingomonas xanthus]
MNEEMRKAAADLRTMPSAEATDWLIARYPVGSSDWGSALTLLDHVSLRKQDNRRLATHYLGASPFAHDRPYRVFEKLLGLSELLAIISLSMPANERDADLLMYHLRPLLDCADTDEERRAASEFLEAIGLT